MIICNYSNKKIYHRYGQTVSKHFINQHIIKLQYSIEYQDVKKLSSWVILRYRVRGRQINKEGRIPGGSNPIDLQHNVVILKVGHKG